MSSVFPSAPTPAASGDSHAGLAGIAPAVASEKWQEEARRRFRTPGAYEWWCFDAVDQAGNGAVVFLFDGLPFHPNYLRAAKRYLKKSRGSAFASIPAEAQSWSYPAAYVAIFQHGRRVAQGLNMYPPEAAEDPAEDATHLRIGPNRITLRQDGSLGLVARVYPFSIRRWQPRLTRDEILTVALNFTPTLPGVQHVRAFRPATLQGAAHHWALVCPHARVTGNIQHVDTVEGVSLHDLHLNCTGYHDHVYGQGPLFQDVTRVQWGYLQGDDWTVVWHHASNQNRQLEHADGLMLIQRGAPPVIIDGPTVRYDRRRFTKWLLPFADGASLHGSDTQGNLAELVLQHGAVTTTAPFYMRLDSRGTLTIPGRKKLSGHGVTHSMTSARLAWPVFSDLVLMAIQNVRADDPLWRQ